MPRGRSDDIPSIRINNADAISTHSVHQEVEPHGNAKDMAGAPLQPAAEKLGGAPQYSDSEDAHNGSHGQDGDEPTEEEKATLTHVGESLPLSAWLVAVVELCERFTFYGVSGIFQNYVQRPRDGSLGRGALGMGQQAATALTTFFQFWCYGMYFEAVKTCDRNADGRQPLRSLGPSSRTNTWEGTRLSSSSA